MMIQFVGDVYVKHSMMDLPAVGHCVVLTDSKYKSKDDRGRRRYEVQGVTHFTGKRAPEVYVKYEGMAYD